MGRGMFGKGECLFPDIPPANWWAYTLQSSHSTAVSTVSDGDDGPEMMIVYGTPRETDMLAEIPCAAADDDVHNSVLVDTSAAAGVFLA